MPITEGERARSIPFLAGVLMLAGRYVVDNVRVGTQCDDRALVGHAHVSGQGKIASAGGKKYRSGSWVLPLLIALLGPLQFTARAAADVRSPQNSSRPVVVPLGAIGFGSIVVDSVRGHVFVSGPVANVVEVFDEAGHLVKVIPSQYGARGMVIVGPTMYVAQTTAGTIERINVTTLADEGPLATGLKFPMQLVFAGGTLWTAVTDPNGSHLLASVSSNGVVTTFSYPPFGTLLLASSPSVPNTLFEVEDDSIVNRLDVTTGTPVVVVSNHDIHQGDVSSRIQAVAVSPDGSRVELTIEYPYDVQELDGSTLHPDGIIYPGQAYPSALAVSPGRGGLLATGFQYGVSADDVRVNRFGTTTPIFEASTQPFAADVMPNGLAMTDDGDRLYVITASDQFQITPSLHVFLIPQSTTTTVTAAPTDTPFGSFISITASVVPASASTSSPTGDVAFYLDGRPSPFATVHLVRGLASFSTAAIPAGAHTVVASYRGDSGFKGSHSLPRPLTVACTGTITGNHSGAIVASSGSLCIVGAHVSGSIVVSHGATVDIETSDVHGYVVAEQAGALRMCSTTVTGSVVVASAAGITVIGDHGDAACVPNTVSGTLFLLSNHHGVEAIGNTAAHVVAVSNNGPGPYPGDTTTISDNGPAH
ncbi:MAG: Ig-like domain-containing protein [Actinomycetota bacterium]|nr:Ig-like domain-containing protein [Actinomycetota bacterium]